MNKKVEPTQLGIFAEGEDAKIFSPEQKVVVCPGDLWRLGDNRLLCGDSTHLEDMQRVCGDDKVKCVITSAPYGIGLEYEEKQDLKFLSETLNAVIDCIDKVASDDCYATLNFADVYRKGDPGFTLMAKYYDEPFQKLGWALRGARVWLKPIGRLMLAYATSTTMPLREYEHVMTWRKGRGKEILRNHGITIRGVWQTFGDNSIINDWSKYDFTFSKSEHAACFPLILPVLVMSCYSGEGDVVLDPFLGLGTSLFAAHHLKRKMLGIEIVPKYVQRTIIEWERFYPGTAVREDGVRFVDL